MSFAVRLHARRHEDGLKSGSITTLKERPFGAPESLDLTMGPTAAVRGKFHLPDDALRIAVVTSKYWGPKARKFTVSFAGRLPPTHSPLESKAFLPYFRH